jgi:hypothetical protein
MGTVEFNMGVSPTELSDDDLERELAHIHEKRADIFRNGTLDQLSNHTQRMLELERAYLERFADKVREAKEKLGEYR